MALELSHLQPGQGLNTKATRETSKLESSRLAKYLGPRVPNSDLQAKDELPSITSM